jgi:4-amino-4-deoxy-L-arabinose transferase-like glycosyltransferase
MSPEQPIDLATCRECRAANATTARRCWLCHADLTKPPPPPATHLPPPLPVADVGPWTFSLSTLFLLVTLLALGMGIFALAPGLGVLYAVLVAPPLFATSIVGVRRRRRGQAWGGKEKAATAALSVAGTLAGLSLLIVAAVVAFFIYCIVAISNA